MEESFELQFIPKWKFKRRKSSDLIGSFSYDEEAGKKNVAWK